MATIHPSVLSDEELDYLNTLPEVITAKQALDSKLYGSVYFSVNVTENIKNTLSQRLGLHLTTSTVPMRWIKGDTAPHTDTGASTFKNTYLVFLSDSPGELVIHSEEYPIEANTGFVFQEGIEHETRCTYDIPRLLLGPMNEFIEPVGGISVTYYPTQSDALSFTNSLGGSGSFTVGDGGPYGGYTSWRIASNSGGTSSQSVVYPNGSVLNADGDYYMYPSAPCFLEGSTILCEVDGFETYVPVEELKKGTLVKTSLDGYKPVLLVGKGTLENPGNDYRTENRLYTCSVSKYPTLKEDLYITGGHSILEFPLTETQTERVLKHFGSKLYVTDKKYRLPACVDERAEPWNSEGTYTIWHFALEHSNETMNYGVYANGGLLVETCSINILKHSNMELK
jgi:hypothetical protein